MVTLNKFSTFFVQSRIAGRPGSLVSDKCWTGPSYAQRGLASLFAALIKFGSEDVISIAGDDLDLTEATGLKSLGWSLWWRSGEDWNARVIGANSLDDISVELINILGNDDAHEIRICPPGTVTPRTK